jgi:hypothetical protein
MMVSRRNMRVETNSRRIDMDNGVREVGDVVTEARDGPLRQSMCHRDRRVRVDTESDVCQKAVASPGRSDFCDRNDAVHCPVPGKELQSRTFCIRV